MMFFKSIEIDDKPIFDKYFNRTTFNNSEKNFSNLFIWRNKYKYEYAVSEDFLFIKAKSPNTDEYFYHVPYGNGNIEEAISLLENHNNGDSLIFNPVLSQMKNLIEKQGYKIKEDRNSFDYIYTTDKLINLKGAKLRNKRRWIKKFKEKYNHTYEPIDKTNIKDAKRFILNLTENNPTEQIAMKEMFDNFFKLNIKGCVIKVDEKIIGVSTGEELTSDTVIIHCERCNRDYEGIYNIINQEFVKNQWSNYKYVNREQDLGIEGLRQAKLTYRPDILLKKHIAKDYK